MLGVLVLCIHPAMCFFQCLVYMTQVHGEPNERIDERLA